MIYLIYLLTNHELSQTARLEHIRTGYYEDYFQQEASLHLKVLVFRPVCLHRCHTHLHTHMPTHTFTLMHTLAHTLPESLCVSHKRRIGVKPEVAPLLG